MCKVVIEAVQQVDNIQKHPLRIKQFIDNIHEKLAKHVKTMKLDVKYDLAAIKQCVDKAAVVGIRKLPVKNCDDRESRQSKDTNKGQSRKILMMTRWQRFSGFDLDKDIELTKCAASPGTYFANQEAMAIINLYQLTQEWSSKR